MSRSKIIIGNWKMNKTLSTAVKDFAELNAIFEKKSLNVEIGIAAPSLFLSELSLRNKNSIQLYAQSSHWEKEGAFTGEVSPLVLKELKVCGSLIAHSERRQHFGETNHSSGLRLGTLMRMGLKGVLCVGETKDQRLSGQIENVLSQQIEEAFSASGLKNPSDFIGSNNNSPLLSIAYEPVWAIGTGLSATSKEAQQAHEFIRQKIAQIFNAEMANKIKILYGGSVKLSNIKEYFNCQDIDGALIGGSSLVPEEFSRIVLL